MANNVTISITGQYTDRDIKRAMRDLQSLQKQGPKTSKSVGGLTTAMKSFGLAIGGTAVVLGMKSFIQNSIGMAVESRKTIQRLDAVAKSMGVYDTVLGGTTTRLQDYAQELQNATGVSDETTKSAQAILLTFSNLANTAGEAGGLFDRATAALLDLSAAGFGDATTNAKSLGKALQDPIKGITALSRQGITFTKQERDKIKALVESNNMLEAQGTIMRAVEAQVGGAAAAMASDFDKISAAVNDAQELIGYQLLNSAESLIGTLGGSGGLVEGINATADSVADFTAGVGLAVEQLTSFGKSADGTGTGLLDLAMNVYRNTPGLGLFITMTEGMTQAGDASRRAQQELNDELTKSRTIRLMYSADARDNADADNEAADAAEKRADKIKRLQDALNGPARNMIAANLRLRELRNDGPRDANGDKKISRDERLTFGLSYAGAVEDKYQLLVGEGKFKKANALLGRSRQYLTGQGLEGFGQRALASPPELKQEISRRDSARGADAWRQNMAVLNVDTIVVNADNPAEAVQKAKQWARLAAVGRGMAAADARTDWDAARRRAVGQ